MELSRELASHLHDLADSIGAGDATLSESVAALDDRLRAAVGSYQGLRLRLVLDGWPITLTSFAAISGGSPAASLRLALSALGPRFDPESRIVFYANRPGALVDLAADFDYLLRLSRPASTPRSIGGDDRSGDAGVPPVALDVDLPPESVVSGLSGLAEYGTVHRAIGVLLGQGHVPDHAQATLRHAAEAADLTVPQYAARLLREEAGRRVR